MREITLELDAVRLRALTWGPATAGSRSCCTGSRTRPTRGGTWDRSWPTPAGGWSPPSHAGTHRPRSPDGSGHVAALMDDAVAVHDCAGGGADAVLIGHDWARSPPTRSPLTPDSPFVAAVALSVPPFPALRTPAVLPALPRQLRNSWYILFNQLPVLPEKLAGRIVPRLWADWSPGYDASDDLPAVMEAMADPAHRRTVIGYYRNMARPLPSSPCPLPPVGGRGDALTDRPDALPPRRPRRVPRPASRGAGRIRAATGSEAHVVSGAGHFLQLERPDEVNSTILKFLATT